MADRPPHHRDAYDRAYERQPRVLKEQRERMYARYHMIKKYGAAVLRGRDLDHIKPLAAGGSNRPSNWRPRSSHSNQGDKTVFHDEGYRPIHVPSPRAPSR